MGWVPVVAVVTQIHLVVGVAAQALVMVLAHLAPEVEQVVTAAEAVVEPLTLDQLILVVAEQVATSECTGWHK